VPNQVSSSEPTPARPSLWPYVLAFAALVALGLAFGETARAARRTVPDTLDLHVLNWVVRHHQEYPGLERLFKTVTRLGDRDVATPATLLVALVLFVLGRRRVADLRVREAVFWLAVPTSAWYLNILLKLWFQRERPPQSLRRAFDDASFSFPSGHAVFAAVFFTMLAILLARVLPPQWRWLRYLAIGLCAVMALLVGASRVWLCVHYVTDVVGGLLLGVSWVILAYMIRFGWARWRRWRRALIGVNQPPQTIEPPRPAEP
jgi:membrane-associated phospholipid phosphatase